MKPELFCQSCTMPVDDVADRGTEANGSKSTEYCKYCYQNGSFVNPGMTLENMKTFITGKMQEMHIPADITKRSMEMLPHLKRWRTQTTSFLLPVAMAALLQLIIGIADVNQLML